MIIPAIDLMDGQCVRLFKGKFDDRTTYDTSPTALAQSWEAMGAQRLHIVDLDGAKSGKAAQINTITKIATSVTMDVQTGGGIRDTNHIEHLLSNGISRVVIGSLAIREPKKVQFWCETFGTDKIILALDVELDSNGTPYPTSSGWVERGERSLWDVINDYASACTSLPEILVTDISKDGVMKGSNVDLYEKILQIYPSIKLITSGGVGSLQDVRALKSVNPNGIIIGKALFEQKFTVAEAIAC